MYFPPPDPRSRSPDDRPTWRRILASAATIAAFPLLLWAVEHPVPGAVVIAVGGGLCLGSFVAARSATRIARCLDRCGECALDLPGTVRVTITARTEGEATG